jgi:hypothetical protein
MMRSSAAAVLVVLLGTSVFACSGEAQGPDSTLGPYPSVTPRVKAEVVPTDAGVTSGPIAIPADYVSTPNGYFHKSCVYAVPMGAHIDDGDNVTVNGTVTHNPPCAHPVFSSTLPNAEPIPTPSGEQPDPPSISHAWVESSQQNLSGNGYNALLENMTVPSAVPAFWYDQQTVYLFPGLQGAGTALLQPVLSFGINAGNTSQGIYGTDSYYMYASWIYISSNNSYYSPPEIANFNDTLTMSMLVVSRSEGNNTWVVQAADNQQNVVTYLYYATGLALTTAFPAALEVYNISSCNDYPWGGSTEFYDIALREPTNNVWTQYSVVPFNPTANQAGNAFNPSCNYLVVSVPVTNNTFLYY